MEYKYSNQVQIYSNLFDIEIMFKHKRSARLGRTDNEQIDDAVSITISPQHAKSLLLVLSGVIAKWEESFGKIQDPPINPTGLVSN